MISNSKRTEVMQTIEQSMDQLIEHFLKPADENWQPADFLPDSRSNDFCESVKDIQALASSMDDDLLTVLVGDTVTEEALPNYESWLMGIDGVNFSSENGWSKWVRGWTAEENRHGDLLNRYLYLSGRVDMKEMEISTQYLIQDGFDNSAGADPYCSFIFTSFQELATNISHRNVASLVKKNGDNGLGKICGVIAADEARHATAYKKFVSMIFEMDPSGAMQAFLYMMKKKIIMPAHNLREQGDKKGNLFRKFSIAAQRIGVYTTQDYIAILESLLTSWDIADITNLTPEAEKARDYLMALPSRLSKIEERMKLSSTKFSIKWIESQQTLSR